MSILSLLAVPIIWGRALILSAVLTLAPPNLNTFMAGKDSPGPPTLEQEILSLINLHRTSMGKPALEMNDVESELAATHSRNMAQGKTPFGHKGIKARGTEIAKKLGFISAMGENVAEGQMNAHDVVDGWLKSPGHKRNIEGDYSRTGIGTARDARGNIFFTQIFTKP